MPFSAGTLHILTRSARERLGEEDNDSSINIGNSAPYEYLSQGKEPRFVNHGLPPLRSV